MKCLTFSFSSKGSIDVASYVVRKITCAQNKRSKAFFAVCCQLIDLILIVWALLTRNPLPTGKRSIVRGILPNIQERLRLLRVKGPLKTEGWNPPPEVSFTSPPSTVVYHTQPGTLGGERHREGLHATVLCT